jgi:hypothetical protein
VTSTPATYDVIQVRSSRLWAMVHFSFTRWLFPARMVADHVGVSTSVTSNLIFRSAASRLNAQWKTSAS